MNDFPIKGLQPVACSLQDDMPLYFNILSEKIMALRIILASYLVSKIGFFQNFSKITFYNMQILNVFSDVNHSLLVCDMIRLIFHPRLWANAPDLEWWLFPISPSLLIWDAEIIRNKKQFWIFRVITKFWFHILWLIRFQIENLRVTEKFWVNWGQTRSNEVIKTNRLS